MATCPCRSSTTAPTIACCGPRCFPGGPLLPFRVDGRGSGYLPLSGRLRAPKVGPSHSPILQGAPLGARLSGSDSCSGQACSAQSPPAHGGRDSVLAIGPQACGARLPPNMCDRPCNIGRSVNTSGTARRPGISMCLAASALPLSWCIAGVKSAFTTLSGSNRLRNRQLPEITGARHGGCLLLERGGEVQP
jgi:hypothetical protein